MFWPWSEETSHPIFKNNALLAPIRHKELKESRPAQTNTGHYLHIKLGRNPASPSFTVRNCSFSFYSHVCQAVVLQELFVDKGQSPLGILWVFLWFPSRTIDLIFVSQSILKTFTQKRRRKWLSLFKLWHEPPSQTIHAPNVQMPQSLLVSLPAWRCLDPLRARCSKYVPPPKVYHLKGNCRCGPSRVSATVCQSLTVV